MGLKERSASCAGPTGLGPELLEPETPERAQQAIRRWEGLRAVRQQAQATQQAMHQQAGSPPARRALVG